MVRFKFLLTAGFLSLLAFGSLVNSPASADEVACGTSDIKNGTCPELVSGGVTTGDGVDLTAEVNGRSGGGTGKSSGGKAAGTGPSLAEICAHPAGQLTAEQEWTLCGSGDFPVVSRHPEWPVTLAAPTTPCTGCSPDTIIRVTDLQNFPAPIAPTGMEPNGWAIVGLAANFWAAASTHIGDGVLLGQPAQVMFTPIGYRWNYGDGSTASTPTGGASWADLAVAEFSTTPTSHKYTKKGTYTVTLTVEYRADYSFGDQGWRPVEGIVTVPSAPFTVVAAKESTVLVVEDCNTNPHGPGC